MYGDLLILGDMQKKQKSSLSRDQAMGAKERGIVVPAYSHLGASLACYWMEEIWKLRTTCQSNRRKLNMLKVRYYFS